MSSVTRPDCNFVNLKPGEQLQARSPLRLLVRHGVAVWLRVSVVQAVFARLLGGVVCVQWITERMCACVVSAVCVFHESLGALPSITACMDI